MLIALVILAGSGLTVAFFGVAYWSRNATCKSGDLCSLSTPTSYNASVVSSFPCDFAGCAQGKCASFNNAGELVCKSPRNEDAFLAVIIGSVVFGVTVLAYLAAYYLSEETLNLCVMVSRVLLIGGSIAYLGCLIFLKNFFSCHGNSTYCSYEDSLNPGSACYAAACHPEQCVWVSGGNDWECKASTEPWYLFLFALSVLCMGSYARVGGAKVTPLVNHIV